MATKSFRNIFQSEKLPSGTTYEINSSEIYDLQKVFDS